MEEPMNVEEARALLRRSAILVPHSDLHDAALVLDSALSAAERRAEEAERERDTQHDEDDLALHHLLDRLGVVKCKAGFDCYDGSHARIIGALTDLRSQLTSALASRDEYAVAVEAWEGTAKALAESAQCTDPTTVEDDVYEVTCCTCDVCKALALVAASTPTLGVIERVRAEARKTGRRPEVEWFADLMEGVLRKNDHKRGWQEMTHAKVIARLREETDELDGAFQAWTMARVAGGKAHDEARAFICEAVDVANFAMMLADNVRRRNRTPTDSLAATKGGGQ
jgi:hypothetical protein